MSWMFKVQKTPRAKFTITESKMKEEKKTDVGSNLKYYY